MMQTSAILLHLPGYIAWNPIFPRSVQQLLTQYLCLEALSERSISLGLDEGGYEPHTKLESLHGQKSRLLNVFAISLLNSIVTKSKLSKPEDQLDMRRLCEKLESKTSLVEIFSVGASDDVSAERR
jgi:hypothetical protein